MAINIDVSFDGTSVFTSLTKHAIIRISYVGGDDSIDLLIHVKSNKNTSYCYMRHSTYINACMHTYSIRTYNIHTW
jgi:hypothetical protein